MKLDVLKTKDLDPTYDSFWIGVEVGKMTPRRVEQYFGEIKKMPVIQDLIARGFRFVIYPIRDNHPSMNVETVSGENSREKNVPSVDVKTLSQEIATTFTDLSDVQNDSHALIAKEDINDEACGVQLVEEIKSMYDISMEGVR